MEKNNKSVANRFSKTMLVLLIILIILFIFSLIILVLRIGDFLPNGTDILFIEPKNPELVMDDDKVVWNGETKIEIFKVENINDEGIVTVLSGSGEKIIAPGTQGYYKFNFKNKGNIAIDYDCKINVYFQSSENSLVDNMPINIRLKDYNGNYLIGDENKWENINELEEFVDKQTIGKKCYVFYEFEWQWAYESGNDELDTFIGNLSSSITIKLIVDISCVATQSDNYEAIGGLQSDIDEIRTGGRLVLIPYLILNFIILVILVVLLILFKNRREKNTEILKETILSDSIDENSKEL